MERINLNVPPAAKAQLKELAAARRVPEGVLARELLLAALERAGVEEFCRRSAAAREAPALQARLREVAEAFERLDDEAS
jgi:hypothetical protein